MLGELLTLSSTLPAPIFDWDMHLLRNSVLIPDNNSMDTCYAPSSLDIRNVASAQLLQAAVAQAFNAVVITNADLSGSGPVIIYCNAALLYKSI